MLLVHQIGDLDLAQISGEVVVPEPHEALLDPARAGGELL
jgi:hypothetical protein